MELIQASTFVKKVGNGVTDPFYLDCNGVTYIAKATDENVGVKHLVNEVVCYLLAKLLEVPIPDAALIKIDQSMIDSVPFLSNRNIQSHILFGSKVVLSGQTNVTPPLLEKVTNQADIPSIMLFDQIIMNEDRADNRGNLIFDFKRKELLAIDHTHAFKYGALWDMHTLRQMNVEKEYLVRNFQGKYYRMLQKYINGNNPFSKIIQKISLVNEDDISLITASIPTDWGIPEEEVREIELFLWHRLCNIREILLKIKNECPQWKGVVA
ncbi:HipA family kinase [Planococcus glaciei]|uniref:HipA family kinase n=1 Tax=Planococcus glaciei TaxID=459472 RepID=UPI002E27E4E3|nr:HipA family kinase [Planococcus glaciei]